MKCASSLCLCVSAVLPHLKYFVALAPYSHSLHLKKAYPRTVEGSEDINNHQNYGITRERIVNLKERSLRGSINSWRPGQDK